MKLQPVPVWFVVVLVALAVVLGMLISASYHRSQFKRTPAPETYEQRVDAIMKRYAPEIDRAIELNNAGHEQAAEELMACVARLRKAEIAEAKRQFRRE